MPSTMARSLVIASAFAFVAAQVPNRPPTYQSNKSTLIMPCNYTGFTDPDSLSQWAVQDFDWSNDKGRGNASGWAKHQPMDAEEMLFEQVHMTTAANPETTVWVYRCSIYAYPWYTSVRTILDDPAYKSWFIQFKPSAPWFSPKCDSYGNPPKCSDYYHMQEQTPGFPHGDGDCAPPGCDCGKSPCGFYLWNHSATEVVNGQTFQDWFVNSYMLNEVGRSPLVSGFFWDDHWSATGGFPDSSAGRIVNDTGMTPADLQSIEVAYTTNMEVLKNETLALGKFAWQLLWTGGAANSTGSTGPRPIVNNATCAADLRMLCNATSPAQTRTMMYAFGGDPAVLPQFEFDLANFLLSRGDYAYIGHGWLGCSRTYLFPEALNYDYGTPLGLCAETSPNVFERKWTNAHVAVDCATLTPTITMK